MYCVFGMHTLVIVRMCNLLWLLGNESFSFSSDPEFVAYDISKTRMQAHRIKPALFDLFLGLAIAAYGFFWYFSVLVSGG